MKLILVLALVFAAAQAAPDYPAVSAKVQELRVLVRSSIEEIERIANTDNPTIGQTVTEKLEGMVVQAAIVLGEAQTHIDAGTLTRPQAEAYMDRLKQILAAAQDLIRPDVEQLSPTAQDAIRSHFESAYVQAEVIAHEIYALLDQM